MAHKTLYTAIFFLALAAMPYPCLAGDTLHGDARADRIVIEKSARELTLISNGHVMKTYKVALGRCPEGAKACAGDNKTPEGQYTIDSRQPRSRYGKALHISYPNPSDLRRARRLGVPPGGDIEIHGLGEKRGWIGELHRTVDWTKGCIAVTNEEIDEIFRAAPVGTMVEIRP